MHRMWCRRQGQQSAADIRLHRAWSWRSRSKPQAVCGFRVPDRTRTMRRLAAAGQQHCGLAGTPGRRISIPSTCVLHLSCIRTSCGAGWQWPRPAGGICGMVQLRHAGCVLSDARIRADATCHFERRPESEPLLGPGGFRRSQPADLARVHREHRVRCHAVRGDLGDRRRLESALRHRAL